MANNQTKARLKPGRANIRAWTLLSSSREPWQGNTLSCGLGLPRALSLLCNPQSLFLGWLHTLLVVFLGRYFRFLASPASQGIYSTFVFISAVLCIPCAGAYRLAFQALFPNLQDSMISQFFLSFCMSEELTSAACPYLPLVSLLHICLLNIFPSLPQPPVLCLVSPRRLHVGFRVAL